MSAISLSKFRTQLFKRFELMRDTDATFMVYHRRKVYAISVKDTGERITTPYKRRPKQIVPSGLIETAPCAECESLLVNGICMNKDCPKNLPQEDAL